MKNTFDPITKVTEIVAKGMLFYHNRYIDILLIMEKKNGKAS